jgi:hypothetical protein
MSTETTTITLRMTLAEVARVDELRPVGCSRSGFFRELLRGAGPLDGAPTHDEAVRLLAESARAGKVQAQVALERALRASGAPDADGELARLLRGE